ncbi:hypothetical protein DPMN_008588 [Dreissena polymorpha]|uniref:Uncharacterized protein n=1 Tax=Dreissena polymorpha TaxID=45954 RepID=A0A9D4MYP4_DREPO|nr:hypothetical protein DPMN_008588 [Dreissena polymorpha]
MKVTTAVLTRDAREDDSIRNGRCSCRTGPGASLSMHRLSVCVIYSPADVRLSFDILPRLHGTRRYSLKLLVPSRISKEPIRRKMFQARKNTMVTRGIRVLSLKVTVNHE